ncbi:MAG TPA: FAD-dependent oxidoreductase, partial [Burkholderiaceae bacterium]
MEPDTSLKSWDVIVIGGGIIGLGTAWALARSGVRVALFEKGQVGAEQSSRNWGWVRTLDRDVAELPLALRANQIWQQLQARVDVGYRRTGLAYLAVSDNDMAHHARWLEAARQVGVDARLIGRGQLGSIIPASGTAWAGALYSPTDGVAEPTIVPGAVARLAAADGVEIFEQCAVRGLDMEGGKVAGIVTEKGRMRAQAVVCAGGAWSRLFFGNLGLNLPQLKVHATAFQTTPLAHGPGPTPALNGVDFTCRPHRDGGYIVSQLGASVVDIVPDSFKLFMRFLPAWRAEHKLLKIRFGRRFFEELRVPTRFALDAATPFEAMRVYDHAPTASTVTNALRSLKQAFPQFEGVGVTRQ